MPRCKECMWKLHIAAMNADFPTNFITRAWEKQLEHTEEGKRIIL
jgi:hypothetical protein